MSKSEKRKKLPVQRLTKKQKKMLDDMMRANQITEWQKNFITRMYHILAKNKMYQQSLSEMSTISGKWVPKGSSIKKNTLNRNLKFDGSNAPSCPSVDTVFIASELLDVSVPYLLGIHEAKTPEENWIHQFTGLKPETIEALLDRRIVNQRPHYFKFDLRAEKAWLDQTMSAEEFQQAYTESLFDRDENLKKQTRQSVLDELRAYKDTDGIWKFIFYSEIESEYIREPKKKSHARYYDAINAIITYREGLVIDLLAEYLYGHGYQILTNRWPREGTSPFDFEKPDAEASSKDILLFELEHVLRDLETETGPVASLNAETAWLVENDEINSSPEQQEFKQYYEYLDYALYPDDSPIKDFLMPPEKTKAEVQREFPQLIKLIDILKSDSYPQPDANSDKSNSIHP